MNSRGLLGFVSVGVALLTGCGPVEISAPKPTTASKAPAESASSGDEAEFGNDGTSIAGGSASAGTPGVGTPGAGTPGADSGGPASGGSPPNALKLACFRYVDATQQPVMYLVDPNTGRATDFGPVGDLASLTITPAGDPETDRVYVVGTNPAQTRFLYIVSGSSGTLLDAFPVADYLNGLVPAPDGSLLYGAWNGTTEDLVRLDPVSRATQKIGTIGDLETWAGLTAVDRASGLLYSQGTDASGQTKTYVNDTRTGMLVRTLPAMRGASLQVDASGALIHLDWNGTQEEVLSFNPITHLDSVLGTVGDLLWWGGLNALDVHNHLLYVFGTPAIDSPTHNLYTVDMRSGRLVQTVTLGYLGAACVGF